MVMKDKLVKTHHKGMYYKTRKFFIGSVVVSSLFCAIAIPTYITLHNEDAKTTLAQEVEDDENKEEVVPELLEFVNYVR